MSIYLSDKDKNNDDEGGGDGQTGVITREQVKTKKPSMYKVLLLNDDYTPMEFVVHVLERFFSTRGREEATVRSCLHVHQNGCRRVWRLHLRDRRNQR